MATFIELGRAVRADAFHNLKQMERLAVVAEMAGDEPAFRWRWGGSFGTQSWRWGCDHLPLPLQEPMSGRSHFLITPHDVQWLGSRRCITSE